jgi:putative endonuclease
MRRYWVYILTNRSRTLYIGVTSDLARRVQQHRDGAVEGFTRRYQIKKLVYAEEFSSVWEALRREKQLKKWRRSKKVGLIEGLNPEWEVLAEFGIG